MKEITQKKVKNNEIKGNTTPNIHASQFKKKSINDFINNLGNTQNITLDMNFIVPN